MGRTDASGAAGRILARGAILGGLLLAQACVMPAKFTAQTLPVPNDPQVRIVQLPAETYAVVRYTGSRAPDAVARQASRLRQAAPAAGWRLVGEPVSWFYDPPWTVPFVRRNEVAIAVTRD